MTLRLPIFEKPRPCFISLTDENNVRKIAEVVLLNGNLRTSNDNERATTFQFR